MLSFLSLSLDPNDQKSLEGMQKMEKEESPTDATQEEDVDDMEGSGEEGDLEGSDSEAAQWADQEQWFGMQWWPLFLRLVLAHEHTTGAILLWRTSAVIFAVTKTFFFNIDSETI